jgi:hypothetical protein
MEATRVIFKSHLGVHCRYQSDPLVSSRSQHRTGRPAYSPVRVKIRSLNVLALGLTEYHVSSHRSNKSWHPAYMLDTSRPRDKNLMARPRANQERGQTVYLTPELETLLLRQLGRDRTMATTLQHVLPDLFPNLRKGRFYGQPLRNFRKAWDMACQQAGVPGMIRHDLRRTDVRNLVHSGIAETVAMKITGLQDPIGLRSLQPYGRDGSA